MDREQHRSPEEADTASPPPLTEGEAEGVVDEPAVADTPATESEPGVPADAIMSNLPRTRPQRITERRRREQARETPAPRRPRAARSQKTQPAPDERSGARSPAAKKSAGRTTAPRRAAASRRRTTARAAPAGPKARTREPAARASETNAPGLPRLAVDGAVEAAKLPLRVGGRLTLRALDAIARGLRNG